MFPLKFNILMKKYVKNDTPIIIRLFNPEALSYLEVMVSGVNMAWLY